METDLRTGLQWGVGTALWVASLVAVAPLIGVSPLAVAADAVIVATPGAVATAAIDTFGKAAQPLLMASLGVAVVGGAALAGTLVGRAPERRRKLGSARFLAPAVAVALYWASTVPPQIVGVVGAAATAVPPLLYTRLDRKAARSGTDHARRGALRRAAAGVGAVGVLGGAAAGGQAAGYGVDADRAGTALPNAKERTGRTVGTPNTGDGVAERTEGELGFDFGGMPPRVEPVEDHYVVDINTQDPTVDSENWSLSVTGAVENGYDLSFDELLNHPDAVSTPVTMLCISNPVGGDLISTTTWRGVPIDSLLEEAGVREEAVDLVTKAVDGYSEAVPVEVAREEDMFLMFGADGDTLSATHGFPARLLIPGRYGMKSTKWIEEIELSTESHTAYWERRNWDEEAVANTISYARAAAVQGDVAAVGGIAFAGNRGIQRVEVSLDGGETWSDAELEEPASEYTWRRWRYVFEREGREEVTATVRATDGTGTVQTEERTSNHPDGSTGWHEETFKL